MKKTLSVVICLCMFAIIVPLFAACGVNNEPYKNGEIRIAAMNGPTMMGLGKLYNEQNPKYTITKAGTADIVTAGLANGTIDAACIPANTAAILFNNGNVDIQVAAINTLNVLYLIQRNGAAEISSLNDLSGKTVYMPGQGTTPDVSFRYLLNKNSIANVNIQFEAEGTTIVAGLSSGTMDYAVLPQPAATSAIMNNSSKVILNLTDEWKKYNPNSDIVTGVLVVRTAFLKNNKSTFEDFLEKYQESAGFMANAENLETAAQYVVDMGIVPALGVAKAALPKCGVTYIEKFEMKTMLTEFYGILYTQNSNSIGGKMPKDNFYYI